MNQKSLMSLTIILGMLGGAMTAMAYLHSTFVTKEAIEVMKDDIKEIKGDVKSLLGKNK